MPQHHLPHLHFFAFKADLGRNAEYIYAVRVVRDIVNKLAFFFLPIFLFRIGSTTDLLAFLPISAFQAGLLTIALFLLIGRVIVMLTSIPISNIIAQIGLSRGLAVAFLLRIIVLILFYKSEWNPMLVWVVAVLEGIQMPFFWNSFHTLLSENTNQKNMGKDLGLIQFLLQLTAAIVPAISGLVAVLYNLEVIYLVAIIGPVVGLALTLQIQDRAIKHRATWDEFLSWVREPEYRRLGVSFIGKYFNDAALFVWPLYVLHLLGSIDKVGYLYSVSLILAMLLNFAVGWYIDSRRSSSNRPFFTSGTLLSLIWLVRLQIIQPLAIGLLDSVDKLLSNFHWLNFDSIWLKRAKGQKDLAYFAYREIVLGIGALLFWSIFIVFVSFNASWNSIFVFAAVGVLLSLLMRDRLS